MRKTILTLGMAAVLTACCDLRSEPVTLQPAEPGEPAAKDGAGDGPAPVKLEAEQARAEKRVLNTGDPLSCAEVKVTNQTEKNLEVNPLYFSLTDAGDTKHETGSALGEYEGQIATTTLAPGENTGGLVRPRRLRARDHRDDQPAVLPSRTRGDRRLTACSVTRAGERA